MCSKQHTRHHALQRAEAALLRRLALSTVPVLNLPPNHPTEDSPLGTTTRHLDDALRVGSPRSLCSPFHDLPQSLVEPREEGEGAHLPGRGPPKSRHLWIPGRVPTLDQTNRILHKVVTQIVYFQRHGHVFTAPCRGSWSSSCGCTASLTRTPVTSIYVGGSRVSGCMEGRSVVPKGTHLNTLSAETPEDLIQ